MSQKVYGIRFIKALKACLFKNRSLTNPFQNSNRSDTCCVLGIGFNMWHVVVGNWNHNKVMKIKCFTDDAKANATETVYEVHGSYEFPANLPNNKLKLRKQKETKFYKCIARDQMDRVISTQFYIITTESKLPTY